MKKNRRRKRREDRCSVAGGGKVIAVLGPTACEGIAGAVDSYAEQPSQKKGQVSCAGNVEVALASPGTTNSSAIIISAIAIICVPENKYAQRGRLEREGNPGSPDSDTRQTTMPRSSHRTIGDREH